MKTFKELNDTLSKFKGQVVTVDLKCPNCNKVTENADSILVDEHLEDYKTESQFYKTHYFTCENTCNREVRYSYINVHKVKGNGTLQEQTELTIKPHLLLENGSIWINSMTQKMLFVEPQRTLNVFSNTLRKAFIPSTDLNEDLEVEYMKLQAFKKANVGDANYRTLLRKYILREYPGSLSPAFFDSIEVGKILDLDDLKFYEINDVPLAQYTSGYGIEAGHFYLDALSPDISSDTSIFDNSADITIAYMFRTSSTKLVLPRKFGQIIKSTNKDLEGRYIELRLHPLYGVYVPVQLTANIPAMYQLDAKKIKNIG